MVDLSPSFASAEVTIGLWLGLGVSLTFSYAGSSGSLVKLVSLEDAYAEQYPLGRAGVDSSGSPHPHTRLAPNLLA